MRTRSGRPTRRLAGKKVLIVDDDVRNIFALTSMLERWEMVVLRAENGRAGAGRPAADARASTLVLMDIMMPEMDGYETIRAIRERAAIPRPADHRPDGQGHEGRPPKCLDAGASDYLAKPVSSEQLLSLLRVWLDRPR